MVTDTFPALALALEPAGRGVMMRPPRPPGETLFSRRFVGGIALYGALITTVTLAAFLLTLPDGAERARAVAFMTLALAQILHLGTARSTGPVLRPSRARANPWALAAVAVSIALQLAALHVEPLAKVLGLEPFSAAEWARSVGLAALPAVAGQAIAAFARQPDALRARSTR
jgi:Ca2+-transporting ATPase